MNRLLITTLASSLLLFTGGIAGAQTARARVADTPIRADANLASAIIATVREGGPVDVVDVQGDWYRVLVPNPPGKPRVGYVLAHLIDIATTDGSSPSVGAPSTIRAGRPMDPPPTIAPSLVQLSQQRDRATAREQALLTEVDALKEQINLLQPPGDQPVGQVRFNKIPRPAAKAPARDGWWGNVGIGLGSLGCDSCDGTLSGGSGTLSLYGPISERLMVGAGTTGYYRSIDGVGLSVGTVDARLRFYPTLTSGFFLTGGLGLGHFSVASSTAYGVGLILGVGWDVPIRSNLSLTPFWNGVGVGTSSGNVTVGQLGVGVTLHHRRSIS